MRRCSKDIYHPVETGALVFGLDETGTIVSVFDKAVNIRLSDRRLVSIVRHEQAMTPMSIHFPALSDRMEHFSKGRSVNFKGGILTGNGWCMILSGTRRFEGFPAAVQRLAMDECQMDRFEKLLHFAGRKEGLLGITRYGEPQNVFARQGRKIAAKMISPDSGPIAPLLASFTGLGPGFTPSGDDLICGFLMGDALDRQVPDRASSAPPVLDQDAGAVLRRATDRTCDAGRTLIRMALQGRFPRFLCEAASELSRAETSEEILTVVTRATRFGHSSGTDALMGLLLYLKIRRRQLMHNDCSSAAPQFISQNHVSFTG